MQARIALCADEQSCTNPQIIGLDGENLLTQEWLKLYKDGQEARQAIARDVDIEEVWVAPCDDVEAINLAAMLKADRPQLQVRLLSFEGGGSLLSRAHTASIDEVLGKRAFIERYGLAKRQAASRAESREENALPAVTEPTATICTAVVKEENAQTVAAGAKPGQGIVLKRASLLAPEVRFGESVNAHGFIVPVVSGSGGAGKSTVSTLSALIAHSMGRRTLILDYDLQFGDVAAMMGVDSPLTIDEAIARPDKLVRELGRSDRPALLAAPERLEEAESIAHRVPELLAQVEESFDLIVANTGAAWAEQHAALLERSAVALFLIDQRSSSVRACRHAIELCSRCGIATGQFQFVLNRCAKGAPLTSIDVSFALQGASVAELKDGGRDVEDYLAAGAASELLESGNDLCTSLAQVLAGLFSDSDEGEARSLESAKSRVGARRRGRHGAKRKGWGK